MKQRTVMGLALAVSLTSPAFAQEPVRPLRQVPETGKFDAAARQLRLTEWGRADDSRRTVHVVLEASREYRTLHVFLPPNVSPSQADAWLRALNARLGWQYPRLGRMALPHSRCVLVRGRESNSRGGLGFSLKGIDLAELGRGIQGLTSLPVLLLVSVDGAHVYEARPPPLARHSAPAGTVLCYRLPASRMGSTPLQVEYGLPPRRIAAGYAALLGLLLLAVAAFRAALAQVQRREDLHADRQLRAYWGSARMIHWVVAVAGFCVPVIIEYGCVGRLLPEGLLVPLLWLPGIVGRRIGTSLERQASPDVTASRGCEVLVGDLSVLMTSCLTGSLLLGLLLRFPLTAFAGVWGGLVLLATGYTALLWWLQRRSAVPES